MTEIHTPPTGFLADNFLDSILEAISQEVSANKTSTTSFSLDIDGIRHLQNSGGRFVYRLMLSNPVNFSPEQVLQFKARNTKQTITATVISSDDDGLIIETEQPLPTDSKLVHVSFDPSLIYTAIGNYLSIAIATPIARSFISRELAAIPHIHHSRHADLNEDQSRSIDEMASVPIHLLWGPPGTGKTTTLGVAISEWMEQGKNVLVVSTSNAAVDVVMRAVLKRVKHKYRKHLLRLGTSLDSEVADITLAGKLRRADYRIASEARAAQDQLNDLSEQLS